MKKLSKEQMTGIAGTALFHALLLLLLLFIVMDRPPLEPEAGLSVVMGDEYAMTEVEVLPQPQPPQPQPQPVVQKPAPERPMITQNDEPSIVIDSVKLAAEKEAERLAKIEEERKRLEEERKRKEKETMEKASSLMANAFGKGSSMGSKGDTTADKGVQGAPDGQQDTGEKEGAGIGRFDLDGRSLTGNGKLPLPAYNVQEEGRVVVTIIVSPEGRVISASIHHRTNTSSPALRNAAIKAAKAAHFNTIAGVNNQEGTITYFFKLK